MSLYKHILVATDFSEASARAIDAAVGFGRAFASKLSVVNAYGFTAVAPSMMPYDAAETLRTLKARSLEELEKLQGERMSELPNTDVAALVDRGTANTIVDHATEHGVDLIIVGSHGRSGIKRMVLGSVAERVVRHAACDVLVVGPDAKPDAPFAERVFVATDLSEQSGFALNKAHVLAQAFNADVCLAHVYDATETMPPIDHVVVPQSEKQAMNARLTRLHELHAAHMDKSARVSVELLTSPSAAAAICERAEKGKYDLIVLSKHGRSAIARMLIGSVAEAVTRIAHRPVLVVHGPAA